MQDRYSRHDSARRHFLTLAGATVAVSMAAGRVEARNVERPTWDLDTDVLCIGSGAAGCAAAVSAAHFGSRVLLVEKLPVLGGTTRRSGGVAWIPNNFVLRGQGIRDDERDCLRYMARYSVPERYRADHPTFGLHEDEFSLLQAFYRHGSEAIDLFQQVGASDFIHFQLPGGVGPSPDYAPRLPENALPRGRALWPDPAVQGGRGAAMVERMAGWLRERGHGVLTGHALTGLVLEDGRVTGAELRHGERILRVRARKGVVCGTGGFAHARDLTDRYQTLLYGSCGAPGSTGDLLPLAMALGARMGDLSTAWRTQVVLEQVLRSSVVGTAVNIPPADSMILVNRQGRRVVNEKRNYNDRTRVHFEYDPSRQEYPNQFLFMVFDQRALDVYGGNFPLPADLREVDYVIQADSLKGLGAAIQQRLASLSARIPEVTLDADFNRTLLATVERFNAAAARGQRDEFGRGEDPAETDWLAYFSRPRPGREQEAARARDRTRYPLDGSGRCYAIILAPGALDTNAGPQINANAQILGQDGQPIPGLYGAGNCIAAPSRGAYYGAGGTIGPALTFGYLAGRHAHQQDH